MEALPELLGGEWGKGGLVVLVEQGVASLAGVVRQVKKTAESVLLPIAEKVAIEVQVKAKIAQNTFETVVMRVMDLMEEMGATMGGPGEGGKSDNAKSEPAQASPSIPPAREVVQVVGEVVHVEKAGEKDQVDPERGNMAEEEKTEKQKIDENQVEEKEKPEERGNLGVEAQLEEVKPAS